jgi:hypothetical protein
MPKKNKAITEQFSNIITPPDFINSRALSVTIIDPEMTEIEDVAFFLKTAAESFNVYVYRSEMNDEKWLNKVATKSIAIVVNTVNTSCSKIKDKLAVNPKTYYYGPKNFLMNRNRIEKPIDYFIQFTNQKEDNVTA